LPARRGAGAELRGRREQAADGADARLDPIRGRQAHLQDDALGLAAALGEGREAFLFDVQRQVGRLTRKPAFRDAWKRGQRCLVVTDGFYEWKKIAVAVKEKQPYAIAMVDDMTVKLPRPPRDAAAAFDPKRT
jgi:hypothetical protein